MACIVELNDPLCNELFIAEHKIDMFRLHLVEERPILLLPLARLQKVEQADLREDVQALPVSELFQLVIVVFLVIREKPLLLIGVG